MLTSISINLAKQDESPKSAGAPKSLHRLKLLGVLAMSVLAGCAMSDPVRDPSKPRALLQPWMTLTGAQTGTSQLGMPSAVYTTLSRPSAMSARDNEVYLADAGLNRIYRYSRAQQSLTPFTNLPVSPGMTLHAAPDRTVYVANPASGEVLHFAWDGTQLPSFVSPGNLARPVSISVDENNGHVLVADSLLDQFIVFDSLGMTLSVIKPRQSLAIAAMAAGPDGIYVADRVSRRVVVLGRDGTFRYALGAKDLGDPSAIAVSRDNLVFVGDNFDHTVKVYRPQKQTASAGQGAEASAAEESGSQLVAKIGGTGIAPGSFNRIDGLAVDGSLLYVTDSMNARVEIMRISR